jgi:hypothetical protein
MGRKRGLSIESAMFTVGQSRHFDREALTSDLPQQADILSVLRHVSKVPILLQTSQNAFRLIFRQKTKQATIASQCVHKRGTEVACEFIAS